MSQVQVSDSENLSEQERFWVQASVLEPDRLVLTLQDLCLVSSLLALALLSGMWPPGTWGLPSIWDRFYCLLARRTLFKGKYESYTHPPPSQS